MAAGSFLQEKYHERHLHLLSGKPAGYTYTHIPLTVVTNIGLKLTVHSFIAGVLEVLCRGIRWMPLGLLIQSQTSPSHTRWWTDQFNNTGSSQGKGIPPNSMFQIHFNVHVPIHCLTFQILFHVLIPLHFATVTLLQRLCPAPVGV